MISNSMHSGYELLDSGGFQKMVRFGTVKPPRPRGPGVWKQPPATAGLAARHGHLLP
jgi:hypothetical protein